METNRYILTAVEANDKHGIKTVVLEPRGLDEAIVEARYRPKSGMTHLVYDVDKLAGAFKKYEKMTLEEAYEWIDYNTARSLPYMASKHTAEPILKYRRN